MEFVESIFLASFSRKQGQLLCARGKKQQTADWRNKVCIISCSSAVVDNLHNLRSSYFLQMTISQKSHRGYREEYIFYIFFCFVYCSSEDPNFGGS